MQRSLKHIRLLATLLIVLVLGLGSASTALAVQPGGITDEAHEMHDLFLIMLYFSIALFVIIASVLVYALIRYRRKNDELPKQVHGSNRIEILWTGIPIIIVIVLFTLSLITLASVEKKAEQNALTIEVTGFQYQWKFVYDLNDLGEGEFAEDGYITIIGTPANEPELVLPVDEVVEFNLKSTDVIHSFYVRDFLYKLDLIPGRINQFSVTPRETGVFRAQCAELCGKEHGFMPIVIDVVSKADYAVWVAEQQGVAAAAAEAATQQWSEDDLMAQGETLYNTNCAGCHMPNGEGLPGIFPSLKGSQIAVADQPRHIEIMLNGVAGSAMQSYAKQLTMSEIAAVVTYERNAWGNDTGETVTPQMIIDAKK